MRRFLVLATLFLGVLSGQAQEKVMNILKTDGTISQTRLAELKQISFLTVDGGDQGLLVTTLGGEMVAVLFESNPVVTASAGKLIIKPSSANTEQFEISDIAEIQFGDATDVTAISKVEGLAFVLQDGGALLRGIPQDVTPRVYSVDGRSFPVPPIHDGQLRLSRETLGSGIFILKAGSFSAKIQF